MVEFSEPGRRLAYLQATLAPEPKQGLQVNVRAWLDHPLTLALLEHARKEREAAISKWMTGRAAPETQGRAAAYDAILKMLSDTRILESEILALLKGS
jgi:hypothetical protein